MKYKKLINQLAKLISSCKMKKYLVTCAVDGRFINWICSFPKYPLTETDVIRLRNQLKKEYGLNSMPCILNIIPLANG